MRLRLLVALLALATLGSCAHAASSLYLYGYGGSSSKATIGAGDSITLWFRLLSDIDDDLQGLDYRTLMPDNDWVMESRNYSDYGWDGTAYPAGFDFARPLESGAFPVVLDEDADSYTYWDDDLGVEVEVVTPEPDFFFWNLASAPLLEGLSTVERFTLTIPEDTPTGRYFLGADEIHGYSDLGDPVDFDHSYIFELSVLGNDGGAIPEPGTLALFGLGLGALALRRARRRG